MGILHLKPGASSHLKFQEDCMEMKNSAGSSEHWFEHYEKSNE